MNEEGFDKELLDLSLSVKNGYLFFINNAGKAIALITIAVAALIIFADIGLADFSSSSFTTTLIAMLASSYIIYFSLEDSGEKLGERCDEYREALKKYKEVRSQIGPSDITPLRAFCQRYARDELNFRRENFITEAGYSDEEFDIYKKGGSVTLRQRYVFSKALKMRAVKLTPALLLSGASLSSECELENPEKKKLMNSLLQLLPSTLCMIFTVSIILTARGDLSPSVIIDGLIKLSALPIIGFRGYTAGYSYVKEKKSVWVESKARLLEAFITGRKSETT